MQQKECKTVCTKLGAYTQLEHTHTYTQIVHTPTHTGTVTRQRQNIRTFPHSSK